MTIDLNALRREAAGPGAEQVLVTRRYLAALIAEIEQSSAKPLLDVENSYERREPC